MTDFQQPYEPELVQYCERWVTGNIDQCAAFLRDPSAHIANDPASFYATTFVDPPTHLVGLGLIFGMTATLVYLASDSNE